MQHIPGLRKGQFIEEGNNFLFGYPTKGGISAENPTATPAGLEEFIATWIERKANPLHFLHFKSDSPATPEFFLYPVNLYEGTKEIIVIKQNLQQLRVDVYPFEGNQADNLRLFHYLVSHARYNCYVNKLDPQFLLLAGNPPSIKEVIQREMQALCNSYNREIRDAITNEQKLRVIVRHVKCLNQLHPFRDGNCRTSFILLNRLLHENNLPFSLILDPNRLDLLSTEEAVTAVKQGQKCFIEFMKGNRPSFSDPFLPDREFPSRPDKLPVSAEKVQQFSELLMTNMRKVESSQHSIESQPHLLSSEKDKKYEDDMSQSLAPR